MPRRKGDPEYNKLYTELDAHLFTPYRKRKIARFAMQHGLLPEEAQAEVREQFWIGFRSYDWNKSHGNVSRFADVLMRNAFSEMSQARKRFQPQAPGGGRAFVSLSQDIYGPAGASSLEELIGEEDDTEMLTDLKRLYVHVYSSLRTERRKKVFQLKYRPTQEYLDFLRNIGSASTNETIARYLGFGKNQIDWDVHGINAAIGRYLATCDEFGELSQMMVEDYHWPMVWVSVDEFEDKDFIRSIIEAQGLDPRPVGVRDEQHSGDCLRVIERYEWGCIAHLRMGTREASMVLLGETNWRDGHVHRGTNGGLIKLNDVLPWYEKLARGLKNG